MNPPRPHIYDADNARLLCQASADAYSVPANAGHVIVRQQSTDTRIVLAQSDGNLIVAFRGTADLRNWLTDLDCLMVHDPVSLARIHAGFFEALNSVWDELQQAIDDQPCIRIWVTGHSLGGALAKLGALWLQDEAVHDETIQIQGVYTLGQPRVGNASFRDYYNARLGDRTFRIVHADDIVPRVPWLLGSYRHAGHEVFFPDLQAEPKFDLPWPRKFIADIPGLIREACYDRAALIEDHHVNNYLALFQTAA